MREVRCATNTHPQRLIEQREESSSRTDYAPDGIRVAPALEFLRTLI